MADITQMDNVITPSVQDIVAVNQPPRAERRQQSHDRKPDEQSQGSQPPVPKAARNKRRQIQKKRFDKNIRHTVKTLKENVEYWRKHLSDNRNDTSWMSKPRERLQLEFDILPNADIIQQSEKRNNADEQNNLNVDYSRRNEREVGRLNETFRVTSSEVEPFVPRNNTTEEMDSNNPSLRIENINAVALDVIMTSIEKNSEAADMNILSGMSPTRQIATPEIQAVQHNKEDLPLPLNTVEDSLTASCKHSYSDDVPENGIYNCGKHIHPKNKKIVMSVLNVLLTRFNANVPIEEITKLVSDLLSALHLYSQVIELVEKCKWGKCTLKYENGSLFFCIEYALDHKKCDMQ